MIDYKPTLVTNLSTLGLPVYYELFVDSSTSAPCITYMELDNRGISNLEVTSIRYSNVSFRIKLWGDDLTQISPYRESLDELMFSLGFTRTNYNELWYNQQVCMICDYQGLAYEYGGI